MDYNLDTKREYQGRGEEKGKTRLKTNRVFRILESRFASVQSIVSLFSTREREREKERKREWEREGKRVVSYTAATVLVGAIKPSSDLWRFDFDLCLATSVSGHANFGTRAAGGSVQRRQRMAPWRGLQSSRPEEAAGDGACFLLWLFSRAFSLLSLLDVRRIFSHSPSL